MQKIIKLSNIYFGVDDSEIKEGDINIPSDFSKIEDMSITSKEDLEIVNDRQNGYLKITHSTQPLEWHQVDVRLIDDGVEGWIFDKIKPLSLSDIEEAIYGYSVEKMAEIDWTYKEYGFEVGYNPKRCTDGAIQKPKFINGYIKGFNAHKELMKEKMFSVDDMLKAIKLARKDFDEEGYTHDIKHPIEIIQSLLPKTEWECVISEDKKITIK